MKNGNPAVRLLDVLIQAKEIDRNTATRHAWDQILNTGGSLSLLHERLSKVMNLSEETFALVNELFPRQLRATSTWKIAVDSAFSSQNINGVFESFLQKITETAIDHLTSAADLLELKIPSRLTKSQISDFISSLNELIEEVLSGDLEDKVKEYLARSLRKIVIALEEYRIGGEIPVTTSIESLLGHSAFDGAYRNALNETDIGARILNLLGGLADAVTVVTPLVPLLLTESVKKMIGV